MVTNSLDLPDTFVLLKVGKKEKKTRVFKKSLTPAYNEQFDIETKPEFTDSHDHDHILKVSLWNRHPIGNHDLLGSKNIDIAAFEVNKLYDSWYSLDDTRVSKPKQKKLEALFKKTEDDKDKAKKSESLDEAIKKKNSDEEIQASLHRKKPSEGAVTLAPSSTPVTVVDNKSQEILDMLLMNTPEDRLSRKLQRQYKAHSGIFDIIIGKLLPLEILLYIYTLYYISKGQSIQLQSVV
jgi:Ca2+-dependent lipid-binding protein